MADDHSRSSREALDAVLASLEQELRGSLIRHVESIVDDAVRAERERCARVCRHRSELWTGTSAAASSLPATREEARSRANEARYLADLIESAEDLFPRSDA